MFVVNHPFEKHSFTGGKKVTTQEIGQKQLDPGRGIADLTSKFQLLSVKIDQREAEHAKMLKNLQTSIDGVRLEQDQLGDRIAKVEPIVAELQKLRECVAELQRKQSQADSERQTKLLFGISCGTSVAIVAYLLAAKLWVN
uniref:(northern house mosquito) hypothetical protein n=1 Tax=Culex pipiens TaxID=7175 RepID=A0A8D8KJZ0_CULPI